MEHLGSRYTEKTDVLVLSAHELIFLISHRLSDSITFTLTTSKLIKVIGLSWWLLIHIILRLSCIESLSRCCFIPIVLLQELDDFVDVLSVEHGTKIFDCLGHLAVALRSCPFTLFYHIYYFIFL